MKAFDFIEARSAREAVAFLTTYGKRGRLFASGTDVLSMLKGGIAGPMEATPEVLISLAKAGDLAGIRYDPQVGLVIGSMARLIEIIEHPVIQDRYPLLVQAASQIASPQLRHTSTIAGNICQL